MDPMLVHTWAQGIKLAIVLAYELAAVPLPEVRQVVPGTPAYDCEMLAVWPEVLLAHDGSLNQTETAISWADPAHNMRFARFAVAMLRCVPTLGPNGDPPSVTDNEAASLVIQQDALMVWDAIRTGQGTGTIPQCASVGYESWAAVEPNGGLGGGVTRVRVAVW